MPQSVAALTAVGELYHAWITGLILSNVRTTGALAIHDRHARLRVDRRPGGDGASIVWRIAR